MDALGATVARLTLERTMQTIVPAVAWSNVPSDATLYHALCCVALSRPSAERQGGVCALVVDRSFGATSEDALAQVTDVTRAYAQSLEVRAIRAARLPLDVTAFAALQSLMLHCHSDVLAAWASDASNRERTVTWTNLELRTERFSFHLKRMSAAMEATSAVCAVLGIANGDDAVVNGALWTGVLAYASVIKLRVRPRACKCVVPAHKSTSTRPCFCFVLTPPAACQCDAGTPASFDAWLEAAAPPVQGEGGEVKDNTDEPCRVRFPAKAILTELEVPLALSDAMWREDNWPATLVAVDVHTPSSFCTSPSDALGQWYALLRNLLNVCPALRVLTLRLPPITTRSALTGSPWLGDMCALTMATCMRFSSATHRIKDTLALSLDLHGVGDFAYVEQYAPFGEATRMFEEWVDGSAPDARSFSKVLALLSAVENADRDYFEERLRALLAASDAPTPEMPREWNFRNMDIGTVVGRGDDGVLHVVATSWGRRSGRLSVTTVDG
jgi:hypothetical protein